MSLPLFFIDDHKAARELARSEGAGNVDVHLAPEEAKHLAALRVRVGEHLVLSDGAGLAFEVELTGDAGRKQGLISVRAVQPAALPYRPNLTLVQGISKGERMDLLVRQCVELGVRRIIPALTARCIVRLDEAKKTSRTDRWRSIARAAAKQSGQPLVPEVTMPLNFDEALELAADEAGMLVIPYEESRDGSIADVLRGLPANTRVFLFVGPEGGFEPSEVGSARRAGAKEVSLGDTILRTETAGVIASALAIYELGGLGNTAARGAAASAPASSAEELA